MEAQTFWDHPHTAQFSQRGAHGLWQCTCVTWWGRAWGYDGAQTQPPQCPLSSSVKTAEPAFVLRRCGVRNGAVHGLPWLVAPCSPEEQAALSSFLNSLPDMNLLLRCSNHIQFWGDWHLHLTTGYNWLSHAGYCFPVSSTWNCLYCVYQSGPVGNRWDISLK